MFNLNFHGGTVADLREELIYVEQASIRYLMVVCRPSRLLRLAQLSSLGEINV